MLSKRGRVVAIVVAVVVAVVAAFLIPEVRAFVAGALMLGGAGVAKRTKRVAAARRSVRKAAEEHEASTERANEIRAERQAEDDAAVERAETAPGRLRTDVPTTAEERQRRLDAIPDPFDD